MTDSPDPTVEPTVITGRPARPVSLSMFADLTDLSWQPTFPGDGRAVLTFAGPLDPDTVTAVLARLTSASDLDQAQRAQLRDLVTQVTTTQATDPTPERELLLLLAARSLDDTPS